MQLLAVTGSAATAVGMLAPAWEHEGQMSRVQHIARLLDPSYPLLEVQGVPAHTFVSRYIDLRNLISWQFHPLSGG
jgi:hypothetical protein